MCSTVGKRCANRCAHRCTQVHTCARAYARTTRTDQFETSEIGASVQRKLDEADFLLRNKKFEYNLYKECALICARTCIRRPFSTGIAMHPMTQSAYYNICTIVQFEKSTRSRNSAYGLKTHVNITCRPSR